MHHATLALLSGLLFCSTARAAEEHVPARLLPSTTVVYFELPNPPQLLSTIFDHPLRAEVEALEPYQQAIRTDGYRGFLAGRKVVEIQLNMEWREALDALTANGIYVGVDSATQGVAVLIHGKDADSLDLFRTKLLAFSRLGDPDRIKEGDYRGITAYEADNVKFAVVNDWLLITNKKETGKEILDRLVDGDGDCLADNEVFQTARQSRPADASGWAFVDLKTLRDAGLARKLFSGESENPGAELIAGGILSTLQHTPFATAALSASPSGLGLQFSVPHKTEWIPEEREYYFGPAGSGRAPELPQTKDTLFTLSTYRDVSEMWLRAGDLFNEQINDGFAEADAGLTTFFSGKDFGEDILGSLTPQIGFVATRRDFSRVLPIPAIKVPQFALVVTLKDPQTMTRELRRTFQSMIGFFNVLGAMQGNAQLEMNMDRLDNGAELITSTYVPEEDDAESTQADIIYNFSPSVGFAGERFVVASTDQLARELVQAESPAAAAGDVNTNATLKAGVLQDVLNDNRDQLIAQNMLEEGHDREEAEAAISLLLELIGYFEDASINLDVHDDSLNVKLQVRVKE